MSPHEGNGELFFHIGLHKTGTTFLQRAVFPKWQGIVYVAWPHLEVMLRLEPGKTHLVSREGLSGKNWAHHQERDRSIKRLAELFPESKILVSFRKHSGYILSSYRQYIQRGGTVTFDEYFDIEGDRGVMKREDFEFRRKLESVERHFRRRPFVFLHEEIIRDIGGLLASMEGYIGGRAPAPSDLTSKRYNESIGYYPAQVLRKVNKWGRSELNPAGRHNLNHPRLQQFRLTPALICQKWLSFLPKRPFINPEQTARIDAMYAEDWRYVQGYAHDRDERAGEAIG